MQQIHSKCTVEANWHYLRNIDQLSIIGSGANSRLRGSKSFFLNQILVELKWYERFFDSFKSGDKPMIGIQII